MHSISDQIRQGEKYGKTARKQIKRHTVNSFSTENDLNAEENGGSTIPVATGGGAASVHCARCLASEMATESRSRLGSPRSRCQPRRQPHCPHSRHRHRHRLAPPPPPSSASQPTPLAPPASCSSALSTRVRSTLFASACASPNAQRCHASRWPDGRLCFRSCQPPVPRRAADRGPCGLSLHGRSSSPSIFLCSRRICSTRFAQSVCRLVRYWYLMTQVLPR